jgi:regulatory protein
VSSEIDKARLFAYKLMNYRPRAERELQRRLEQEVTEITIYYLKRLGYIEDRAFARYWVKVRFGKKGFFGLRRELLEKGIDTVIINEIMAERGPEDEYICALNMAKKKINISGGICSYPRLAGFLGRRGFSYEVIHKVCQALGCGEV